MSNVFSKKQGRPNRVNRNTYDLSFANNLTTKFGQLTPVFCKEVLPGDTFNIRSAFGLQFMPMAFPVQTRMRADLHFFYVRNRNLWKDWPDFIGQTNPKSTPPYRHIDKITTGDINDYLGVPTTFTGSAMSWADVVPTSDWLVAGNGKFDSYRSISPSNRSSWSFFQDGPGGTYQALPHFGPFDFLPRQGSSSFNFNSIYLVYRFNPRNLDLSNRCELLFPRIFTSPSSSSSGVLDSKYDPQIVSDSKLTAYLANFDFNVGGGAIDQNFVKLLDSVLVSSDSLIYSSDRRVTFSFDGSPSVGESEVNCAIIEISLDPLSPTIGYPEAFQYIFFSDYENASLGAYLVYGVKDLADVDKSLNVFNSHNKNNVELSALPYRAYEAIYNSFYRDDRNNPRLVDGRPEYNKYITTDAGDQDTTDYKLFFRNWEQDFLTTSVPSPQQGVAPLVGISSTGRMTFADPEDSSKSYQVQGEFADDGQLSGVNYLENVPGSVQRSLIDFASSGISINDFRNVNAFQRWLETNIRRGLKYKDQIKSHFDVDVSYQELDMPEFIGGVSEPIQVNKISQTSEATEGSPLGSFAGQASCIGQSKHRISHYCDEHGFIIGILSVVPVPNYSQLLPKFFLKNEPLDYFFPEFGKIGLQPIRNKEVAPVQSFVDNNSPLDGVFGYQRPWYDYLSSTDEVHGDFRTTLRDFLLNRVFRGVPKLGSTFTIIDPNQLNDVFTDTDDNDKILGQLYFECYAKRPIPVYGIPQLEADI